MYRTIQALVLRVNPYNDTDAMLTLLSRDQGKVTVKARGLRRKNSPLTAPCQLLAYGEFTLFDYRGMSSIQEAHSLELFLPLRRDLPKLSLGTYFAQVAEVLSQEDAPDPELLSLTLNCLHALSRLNLPEAQIKAVFELRSACIAGYLPDLHGCKICQNPFPERFDIADGCLECACCRDSASAGIRMPVEPGILEAMRYICQSEPKQLLQFTAREQTLAALAQISESYLLTQLERGFSALDFYKSLI